MITEEELITRLLLATLCGAVVGLDRERKEWVAGLRTHMLVCLGSALVMIVSVNGYYLLSEAAQSAYDPSRIASQVVSGIGFLGAGTIYFLRTKGLQGLTTAAGLWAVAGIGLAAGLGMILAASLTTGLTIAVLWLLKPVERRLFPRGHTIHIVASPSLNWREKLLPVFTDRQVEITSLHFAREDREIRIELTVNKIPSDLVDTLKDMPDVKRITL